jgi:light-harvesting complex 1 beta chain
MADKNGGSWTGLTDAEAEEFHRFYLQGTFLFVGIAVVAHFLVWLWRPWIPGPKGYAMLDGVTTAAQSLLSTIV